MNEDREKVYCKKCGRLLKTPDSIKRGYGYSCWKIHILEEHSRLFQLTTQKER